MSSDYVLTPKIRFSFTRTTECSRPQSFRSTSLTRLLSRVEARAVPTVAGDAILANHRPLGEKLVLKRSRTESGAILHEMSLGSPLVVAFTRGSGEGVLLESAGLSLRFFEADLGLSTVRCWIGAMVSKIEPGFVEIAAALRLLKAWTGEAALGDVFFPATVLWQVADAPDARPSGPLRVDRGPFKGEPWDRLADDALQQIGKR